MVLKCTNEILEDIDMSGSGMKLTAVRPNLTSHKALNSQSRACQNCALARCCSTTCGMFLIVFWRPDVVILLQGLDGICAHLDRIFSSGMLFSTSLPLCIVTILASFKTKRFETQVTGASLTCGDDWSQNTFALFHNKIPQFVVLHCATTNQYVLCV